MVSKDINITKEVYDKLIKIKKSEESFSELLERLLKSQKQSLLFFFGSWDLTDEEINEYWGDIIYRKG
ncbi:MAG: antitoxin VapB family protein [Promethearchaeota archaeon]